MSISSLPLTLRPAVVHSTTEEAGADEIRHLFYTHTPYLFKENVNIIIAKIALQTIIESQHREIDITLMQKFSGDIENSV